MTDPVPSKDLVTRLRSRVIGEPGGEPTPAAREYFAEWAGAVNDGWQAADEIERLRKQVDELSIHAEKWVKRVLDQGAAPEPPVTPSERLRRVAFELSDIATNCPRELNRSEMAKIAARMLSASAHVELGERAAQPPRDGQ